MTETSRTTLLGVVVGVLLLGAVFAFTVLLPELGEDPAPQDESAADAPAADLPPAELPDELDGGLDGGLVAADTGSLPPEVISPEDVEALREQQASIGEQLEAVFGVPGASRLYASSDGSAGVELTVLDTAPGLFRSEFPPIDPALVGAARAASELVAVDDAVCMVEWGQAVPLGQPVDAAQPPQSVRCQLGAGERTYEISARGYTPEDAVALLDEVVA